MTDGEVLLVGAEKSLTVVMNEMVGRFGHPNLRFPRELSCLACHFLHGMECGHVDTGIVDAANNISSCARLSGSIGPTLSKASTTTSHPFSS